MDYSAAPQEVGVSPLPTRYRQKQRGLPEVVDRVHLDTPARQHGLQQLARLQVLQELLEVLLLLLLGRHGGMMVVVVAVLVGLVVMLVVVDVVNSFLIYRRLLVEDAVSAAQDLQSTMERAESPSGESSASGGAQDD